MSFQDSEAFISFYPYRQIYGEVSGYLNENIYFKLGYDIYKEALKHKVWEIFPDLASKIDLYDTSFLS